MVMLMTILLKSANCGVSNRWRAAGYGRGASAVCGVSMALAKVVRWLGAAAGMVTSGPVRGSGCGG